MRLYVLLTLVLALAVATAYAQQPKPFRAVPPECKWGTTWPSFDPVVCGVPTEGERREERARRRAEFYAAPDAQYCVISPAMDSVPVCVFKDLDTCKRASRDELWRKAYPDAEWCKPKQ